MDMGRGGEERGGVERGGERRGEKRRGTIKVSVQEGWGLGGKS